MNTSALILILIGLSAGIASGLFGIGGGVLIVPALIYLLDFSQHRAIGTSLVVLLPPVGLAAVVEYYRSGHVDWKAALILAVTLFIGAGVGAYFSNRLGGPILRLMFGVFVVLVGLYTVYGALLSWKSAPTNGQTQSVARLE